MKLCLEEIGHRNLSTKNWLSILCSFVMVQGKIGSLSCVVLLWCREKNCTCFIFRNLLVSELLKVDGWF